MLTKTITLSDGFEVTFRRRTWVQVRESIRRAHAALAELNLLELGEGERELRIALFRMDQQEQALAETVENWPEVCGRLSIAGFAELEKAVDEFSKAEVVAGN